MPAFVEVDYTDDGCYIWECSECDRGIEGRGNYGSFKLCPYCGVEFTHNLEANCPEALRIRDRRRPPWNKPKTYWLKIVRINFHTSTEKLYSYSGDLRSFFELGGQVSWYDLSRYPPHLKTDYYCDLSRNQLIRLIKDNRADPKWFGIGEPEDRKQTFYGYPGTGKTEFVGFKP